MIPNLKTHALLVAFLFFSFAGDSKCSGDLILDVQNVVLSSGGTGTIDVLISSTTTDVVDGFSYDLQISPSGTNLGNLQFSNPQSNNVVTDSNYIHVGNTGGNFTVFPLGAMAMGGDASLDGTCLLYTSPSPRDRG